MLKYIIIKGEKLEKWLLEKWFFYRDEDNDIFCRLE